DCLWIRRRGPAAGVRRAADPARVPDDPGVAAAGERSPRGLQIRPGDRPRQPAGAVHAPLVRLDGAGRPPGRAGLSQPAALARSSTVAVVPGWSTSACAESQI